MTYFLIVSFVMSKSRNKVKLTQFGLKWFKTIKSYYIDLPRQVEQCPTSMEKAHNIIEKTKCSV